MNHRIILLLLGAYLGLGHAQADTWTSELLAPALPSESANAASGCQVPIYQSADGRYVAFCSEATNLVPQQLDLNDEVDVFIRDLQTGQTVLISHQADSASTTANGGSVPAAISPNGRFVLFFSRATNLIQGLTDGNGGLEDVFLFDRQNNTTVLVSHAHGQPLTTGNGVSSPGGMSDDGNWITISSEATDLLSSPIPSTMWSNVYLIGREQGSTQLISRTPAGPNIPVNGPSASPRISGDGSRLIFATSATDVLANVVDNNNQYDLYRFDRLQGSYELITHAAGNPNATGDGAGGPFRPYLSPDGNYVLFNSEASNLIAGVTDNNAAADVFLENLESGSLTLVSRSNVSATTTPNAQSFYNGLSADGTRILFNSQATNVQGVTQDANEFGDAFVFDVTTGQTTLISRASGETTVTSNSASGGQGISADGNHILYASWSTNVVPNQNDVIETSDLFLYHWPSGTTSLLTSVFGQPNRTLMSSNVGGNLSHDGSHVLLVTDAHNFLAPGRDTNGQTDVFSIDLLSGLADLVSTAESTDVVTGNFGSGACCFSADASSMLIGSASSNILPGVATADLTYNLFILETESGARTRVTQSATNPNTAPTRYSGNPRLSADGNFVLYESEAPDVMANLDDQNGFELDVFLFDRLQNTTILVSRSNNNPGRSANGPSKPIAISANGRFALYQSEATDVIPGSTDGNGETDLFIFDRTTGQSTLVTRALGAATVAANAKAYPVAMLSADGEHVFYSTEATNVVTGVSDSNGTFDAYLFDRSTGNAQLISHRHDNAWITGSGYSFATAMTPSAGTLLLDSAATDLVAGITDLNAASDVFLVDAHTGTVSLVSRADSAVNAAGNQTSIPVAISETGDRVVFESSATDLVPGIVGSSDQGGIYLFDRTQGIHLVSRRFGTTNVFANGYSWPVWFSPDGQWLTLRSNAQDLIAGLDDPNGALSDMFVYDVGNRTHSLVSRSRGTLLHTGNQESYAGEISQDGRLVIFGSEATDLVTGVSDANSAIDGFLATRRFDVSIAAGPGGSVSPFGSVAVEAGQRLSLSVQPDPGFQVDSVAGCGSNWTGSNPLLTAPLRADCVLSITFMPEVPSNAIFVNSFE